MELKKENCFQGKMDVSLEMRMKKNKYEEIRELGVIVSAILMVFHRLVG